MRGVGGLQKGAKGAGQVAAKKGVGLVAQHATAGFIERKSEATPGDTVEVNGRRNAFVLPAQNGFAHQATGLPGLRNAPGGAFFAFVAGHQISQCPQRARIQADAKNYLLPFQTRKRNARRRGTRNQRRIARVLRRGETAVAVALCDCSVVAFYFDAAS